MKVLYKNGDIVEDQKAWIIKMVKGVKIVICPYCGRHEAYPHDECICGNSVAMPVEKEPVKKEWW